MMAGLVSEPEGVFPEDADPNAFVLLYQDPQSSHHSARIFFLFMNIKDPTGVEKEEVIF